jgi:hypothetical protein
MVNSCDGVGNGEVEDVKTSAKARSSEMCTSVNTMRLQHFALPYMLISELEIARIRLIPPCNIYIDTFSNHNWVSILTCSRSMLQYLLICPLLVDSAVPINVVRGLISARPQNPVIDFGQGNGDNDNTTPSKVALGQEPCGTIGRACTSVGTINSCYKRNLRASVVGRIHSHLDTISQALSTWASCIAFESPSGVCRLILRPREGFLSRLTSSC